MEGGRKRTKEKTGTKERAAPMAIMMIVVVAERERRAKHSSRFKSAMHSLLSFFPSFLLSLFSFQLTNSWLEWSLRASSTFAEFE